MGRLQGGEGGKVEGGEGWGPMEEKLLAAPGRGDGKCSEVEGWWRRGAGGWPAGWGVGGGVAEGWEAPGDGEECRVVARWSSCGVLWWPTPARGARARGEERRRFQREWNEEDVGLLIEATGGAGKERISRIPEVGISSP